AIPKHGCRPHNGVPKRRFCPPNGAAEHTHAIAEQGTVDRVVNVGCDHSAVDAQFAATSELEAAGLVGDVVEQLVQGLRLDQVGFDGLEQRIIVEQAVEAHEQWVELHAKSRYQGKQIHRVIAITQHKLPPDARIVQNAGQQQETRKVLTPQLTFIAV